MMVTLPIQPQEMILAFEKTYVCGAKQLLPWNEVQCLTALMCTDDIETKVFDIDELQETLKQKLVGIVDDKEQVNAAIHKLYLRGILYSDGFLGYGLNSPACWEILA